MLHLPTEAAPMGKLYHVRSCVCVCVERLNGGKTSYLSLLFPFEFQMSQQGAQV